eukprot:Skav221042  [mRNA]  locus=scaffold1448:239565:248852:+ [translate_table: standard]
MVLTVDLSRWNGDANDELVVGDFELDDHTAIRSLVSICVHALLHFLGPMTDESDALLATEHMEDLMHQEPARPLLEKKLAQLAAWQLRNIVASSLGLGFQAFGLRALQRASMKHQLRSVGLSVLETERKVGRKRFGQRKVRGSRLRTPWRANGTGEERAEQSPSAVLQPVLLLSAPEKVLRRRAEADDEFLGGFVRKQFDQAGPLQRMPYAYRPFFQPPAPDIDPAALMSPAERKKSFITDPLSEILGPGGTVDPRQGGANMDPRQLLTDGTIAEGLLHLHSQMVSSCVEEVCSAELRRFDVDVGHVLLHLLAPALRVAVAHLGQRLGRGAAELRGADGGELQGTGSFKSSGASRVRPEFALQWRQNFEQVGPWLGPGRGRALGAGEGMVAWWRFDGPKSRNEVK